MLEFYRFPAVGPVPIGGAAQLQKEMHAFGAPVAPCTELAMPLVFEPVVQRYLRSTSADFYCAVVVCCCKGNGKFSCSFKERTPKCLCFNAKQLLASMLNKPLRFARNGG